MLVLQILQIAKELQYMPFDILHSNCWWKLIESGWIIADSNDPKAIKCKCAELDCSIFRTRNVRSSG